MSTKRCLPARELCGELLGLSSATRAERRPAPGLIMDDAWLNRVLYTLLVIVAYLFYGELRRAWDPVFRMFPPGTPEPAWEPFAERFGATCGAPRSWWAT